jgi:Cu-processing system ATP-binding protein
MIRIENLYKRFKKLDALANIQTTFEKGKAIALIGPNGSGKTTLIKTILGLVKPDKGTIYFDGKAIQEGVDYRSRIGYMPQIGRYPDNMKVGQLFAMLKNVRKGTAPALDEELYYQFKLDTILEKSMRTLSGGTRQKVSAALAFLFDPEVLVLDEPTAGLDPLSSELLKEKILAEKRKGKLILITSHVLSDLEEMVTDVVYLYEGRIIFEKKLEELQKETGEEKLGKAIAVLTRRGLHKQEVAYLKIAK